MSSFKSEDPPHTRIITIELSDEDIRMLEAVRSFLHLYFPVRKGKISLASRFSIWYHKIEIDL